MLATDGAYCPFIHLAGDLPRPRPWQLPQRRLAHYLLVTSLGGEEELVVEGQRIQVAAGASYLIQPGVLADIGSAAGSTPAWIHFDVAYNPARTGHRNTAPFQTDLRERAHLMQPGALATWGVDLPILVPAKLSALMRDGVRNVVRCWTRQSRLAQFQANHLLAGLLLAWVAWTWERAAAGPLLSSEAKVARAEALALGQLDTDFGVDDFAAAAGYSRSRFCALYQSLRHNSPGAFLRRLRMQQAETLLARPDLPIAQVGAMVGYRDPTVFGRVFRGHAGCSPGEWRRRLAAG